MLLLFHVPGFFGFFGSGGRKVQGAQFLRTAVWLAYVLGGAIGPHLLTPCALTQKYSQPPIT